MEEFKKRTKLLLGDKLEKLSTKKITIVGLGGVGSYVFESLIRAGIENFILIDKDIIDVTNINRQILALTSTVGKAKVDVAKQRGLEINPNANIEIYKEEYNEDFPYNISSDYIIDAIDDLNGKISLIKYADKQNIKIISSMGTGNRVDADFEISKLSKTSYDPIAKILRKKFNEKQLPDINVVYSKSNPYIKTDCEIGSISYGPAIAGLKMSEFVIKDLLEI